MSYPTIMRVLENSERAPQANNVRVTKMNSEELGQYVAEQTLGILRRTEELRPLYMELWKRFDKLTEDETICGCRSRTEYCEKILHRTIRSVQHVLRGPRKPSLAPKEDFKNSLHSYDRNEVRDFVPEDIREEDDKNHYQKRVAEQEAWEKANPEKAAERKRKADEKAKERQEERDRGWAKFEERHHIARFDATKQPPARDIQEFANLGRREAARRYNAGSPSAQQQERMAQLNQVADWLEKLAGV